MVINLEDLRGTPFMYIVHIKTVKLTPRGKFLCGLKFTRNKIYYIDEYSVVSKPHYNACIGCFNKAKKLKNLKKRKK